MFQQPFAELLASIPVPERVHQALRVRERRTVPALRSARMVRAIENEESLGEGFRRSHRSR